MEKNNFYTASYLGARLEQILCLEKMNKIPRKWHTLFVNPQNKGAVKITHILFYGSILKVVRDFYKKSMKYFSGQEMYVMIRYLITVLCFDILKRYYFSAHIQGIQFVYAPGDKYFLKNLERNNDRYLENMTSKIDFQLFVEELGSRYFPDRKIEGERYDQIAKKMQEDEFLPVSYLEQFHELFGNSTTKTSRFDSCLSNEATIFKLYDFFFKRDDQEKRLHLYQENKELSVFLEKINSNFQWTSSINTAGYNKEETKLNKFQKGRCQLQATLPHYSKTKNSTKKRASF